ncbi:MAG: hypothetical protein BGO01_10345 [Armatimonadetes bacterium 55-13]|nr:class I SAM-dependent methyltransferase [Armatimonadota bacterium]OJU62797.1 MAG: hypothetical protein BGO01_10345 [Armatimonadetes bacterium 55-13]
MFSRTARFYDAIYSFKDYAQEAERVHEWIEGHRSSPGSSLLDVGCGTGKHLAELSQWYQVEGLDLDGVLLDAAREKLPEVAFHQASMVDFELGKTFDAVTCLFSSIGYLSGRDEMRRAIATMAKHLAPGGVLLVEPWLYPTSFQPGHLSMLTVDEPDLKICRMAYAAQDGEVSLLEFEYLIGSPEGIVREREQHRLFMFSQQDYEEALTAVGLRVDYDPLGPTHRGLFIGIRD